MNTPRDLTSEPLVGVERLHYERSVVTPYTTAFGWRSLFNAAWPMVGWVSVVAAYRADKIPLLAGIVLAAVFLQAFYMPVHEAVHRTISAGRQNLVWIDRAVGSVCAFMLSTSFVEHRHTHLLHHTHANEDADPDFLNAKGSPLRVAARTVMAALLYLVLPVLTVVPGGRHLLFGLQDRLKAMDTFRSRDAKRGATLVAWGHIVLLATTTLAGFAVEAWLLFYVPVWIGRVWLSLVFAWFPHHPHSEVGRYRDTRVFTFFASNFLIRGHDYHLIHHLFPRVPHYKLRSVWRDIAPHLVVQGARIEGTAARKLGIAPQ